MSEKEIILARVEEKQKLKNAWRDMTRMLIFASGITFSTLIFIWMIRKLGSLNIPALYHWNSLTILISSLLAWKAQTLVKSDEPEKAYKFIGWTLISGILFFVIQSIGWQQLIAENENSRNILLPFSIVHLGHVLIGIILLGTLFIRVSQYRVHSKNNQFANNIIVFWHFLGGIWLALLTISLI